MSACVPIALSVSLFTFVVATGVAYALHGAGVLLPSVGGDVALGWSALIGVVVAIALGAVVYSACAVRGVPCSAIRCGPGLMRVTPPNLPDPPDLQPPRQSIDVQGRE